MSKPYRIEITSKDGVRKGLLKNSDGGTFSFKVRRLAERLADLTERNDAEGNIYNVVKF